MIFSELRLEDSHFLVITKLVLLAKLCAVEVAMLKMSRALSSPRCVLKSQRMNGFPWETGCRSLRGLGQCARAKTAPQGSGNVNIKKTTRIQTGEFKQE